MTMPGQAWLGAAAAFLGMWVVMMVAMMLPSLVPTLWRYRQAGLGLMTLLVGVGYFVVWTVFGLAAFLLAAHEQGHQDRKSTRLNSSHGYISYAVFCLKKKNTNSCPRCWRIARPQ